MARSLIGGLAQVGAGYLTGTTEERRRRELLRRQALMDAMEVARTQSGLQTAGLEREYLGRQIAGYSSPAELTALQHGLAMQRMQAGWGHDAALMEQRREAIRATLAEQLRAKYKPAPRPSVGLQRPAAVPGELMAVGLQAPLRAGMAQALPSALGEPLLAEEARLGLVPSTAQQPRVGPQPEAALPEPPTQWGTPLMTLPRGVEGSEWQERMRAAGVEAPLWGERPLAELLAAYGEAGGEVGFHPDYGLVPMGRLPTERETRRMEQEDVLAGLYINQARERLRTFSLANEATRHALERLPVTEAQADALHGLLVESRKLDNMAAQLSIDIAEGRAPIDIETAMADLEMKQISLYRATLGNALLEEMLASDDPDAHNKAINVILGIHQAVTGYDPATLRLKWEEMNSRERVAALHVMIAELGAHTTHTNISDITPEARASRLEVEQERTRRQQEGRAPGAAPGAAPSGTDAAPFRSSPTRPLPYRQW